MDNESGEVHRAPRVVCCTPNCAPGIATEVDDAGRVHSRGASPIGREKGTVLTFSSTSSDGCADI